MMNTGIRRLTTMVGGLVRLVRPLNCLMIFVGSLAGGIIAAAGAAFRWPANADLLLASLSAALIGAAGNAINDVFDREIDRINRPNRPIPSGAISPAAARVIWVIFGACGIALGAVIGVWHLTVAAACVVALYVYSRWLKSIALVGNVVVGGLVAMSILYGAMSIGGWRIVLPAMLFAFLTNLARELMKDVQDLAGDAARAVRSFPVRAGPRTAGALYMIVVGVTLALTPIPFVALEYSTLYLLLVLIADGFLVAALWAGLQSDLEGYAGRASTMLKFAMFWGLGALSTAGIDTL